MKTQTPWLMCILLALAACLPRNAHAQTDNSDPPPKTYKNHIGINTQWLESKIVDRYSPVPLRVMYKRQIGKRSALRVELGTYYKSRDTAGYQLPGIHVKTTVLSLKVGYEWQRALTRNQRLMLIYGADVQFHYLQKDTKGDYTFFTSGIGLTIGPPDEDVIYRGYRNTRWRNLSLRPFVGIRCNLGKRAYFSYEMSIVGNLKNYSVDANFAILRKDESIGEASEWGDLKRLFIEPSLTVNALQGFNLFYLF